MKITERKPSLKIMSVVKFHLLFFFFPFYLISCSINKLELQLNLNFGCLPCLPHALGPGCLSVQLREMENIPVPCAAFWRALYRWSSQWQNVFCDVPDLFLHELLGRLCGVRLPPPHRWLLVLPGRVESVGISGYSLDFPALGLCIGEVNACVYMCIMKC